jgi:HEAT repeat protein
MGFLGKFKSKPKTEELINQLDDDDEKVRRDAGFKLIKMGESVIEPLIEAMKTSFQVYYGPPDVLASIGQPAVEPLVRTLENGNSTMGMRTGAALALVKMSGRADEPLMRILRDKAIEPLIEMLTEYDKKEQNVIVMAICTGLGRIGDPRAVEPLKKALETWKDDTTVSQAAEEALERLGTDRGK